MKILPVALLCALLPVTDTRCQSHVAVTEVAVVDVAVNDDFVLEPGTYEIPALVDSVAAHLEYNILYSEAELAGFGQIRVTRRVVVGRHRCWELFGALLYHKGLAILALDPQSGFYEVIAINGPRSQEVVDGALFVPFGEVESYANQKATPILTSVPLENINATIATNALRPFFASNRRNSGMTIGNVGNNTDILLQGFGPQVVMACRLLKLVDVGDDSSRPTITLVYLEHIAPESLVARLDDVFGPRAMQAQMQSGMPVGAPLRAVAHPELNAVILSGSAGQLRDAAALIDKLDKRGERGSGLQVLVIRLEHAAPDDIATRVHAAFGQASGPPQVQGGVVIPPLRVVASPAQSAVILSGTAGQIRDAQVLVAKLDVPAATDQAPADEASAQIRRLEQQIQKLERALRAVR